MKERVSIDTTVYYVVHRPTLAQMSYDTSVHSRAQVFEAISFYRALDIESLYSANTLGI